MLATLRYFIIIAVLAVAAVWLADQPGSVSMEWAGYQIDTSFGVLAIAVGAVAVASALIYRFWLFMMRAPGSVRGAWRTNRRNKGFQALTKGMVAVAAGDAEEAKRQAKRAEGILSDPPLTMLLSAQAAQLNGDERAAERFFKAMTDNHETEFLGLRGLLNQAMARGDTTEAVALARRAHRLKPNSEWVSKSLFELQTRTGQWLDASVTVREASRNKQLTSDVSHRRQAVLAYQLSMSAAAGDDSEEALKQARAALAQDDSFLPAVLGVARMWNDLGKHRKAGSLIEKAWTRSPHPDLVAPYLTARGLNEGDDPLKAVKVVERLIGFNKGHLESDLAMARSALDADLWGQARKHLMDANNGDNTGDNASKNAGTSTARGCRMMAALEEAEHADMAKVRQWLMAASLADPDPAYVCADCGHTVRDWVAVCDNCQSFDRHEWRVPPHAGQLADDAEASDDADMLEAYPQIGSDKDAGKDTVSDADPSGMLIEHQEEDPVTGKIKPFSAT